MSKYWTWAFGTATAVLGALAALAVPPLAVFSAATAAKLLAGATVAGILSKSPLPHKETVKEAVKNVTGL